MVGLWIPRPICPSEDSQAGRAGSRLAAGGCKENHFVSVCLLPTGLCENVKCIITMSCHTEEPPSPPPREGNTSRPLKSKLCRGLPREPGCGEGGGGVGCLLLTQSFPGGQVSGLFRNLYETSFLYETSPSTDSGVCILKGRQTAFLRRTPNIKVQDNRRSSADLAPIASCYAADIGGSAFQRVKDDPMQARGLTHACTKHRHEVWGYFYRLFSLHLIMFLEKKKKELDLSKPGSWILRFYS